MNPTAPTQGVASRLDPQAGPARYAVVASPAVAASDSRPRAAAAALIGGWVVLNLAYLALACPHSLAPDEAHYWHWSRHLDWSYYSKGPLVAWLIRGSCELFGGMSVRLVGSEMVAVRLPAVACSGALLAGLYALARSTLGTARAALAVVAAACTLPPVAAAAVLMTTDPPFLACWAWGLVFVGRAVGRAGTRGWAAAGVCCALGVLAKYPMLLLPAAVVGYLLTARRDEFGRPGVWVFLGLTGLGCLPILAWAAGHDWVSFRHALGQTGIGDGVRPRAFQWDRPFGFAAGQFGALLGFWLVAFLAAGWRFRRAAVEPSPTSPWPGLLWWSSVPVWGVFLLASTRNPGQLNWPAAAYVGGFVLAVGWVREQLEKPAASRRWILRGLVVSTGVGLAASVWLHFPGLVRPLLARVAGPADASNPAPVRGWDPTCRVAGWPALAAEVDRIGERVERETGRKPLVSGMLWTTPGELAFYGRGHPPAYSFGLALADRHSQYDVWRPNPVADAQAFGGASFVYVGDEIPGAAGGVFDRVEPPVRLTHLEDGIPLAAWTIWVGHGFRGLPESIRVRPRDY